MSSQLEFELPTFRNGRLINLITEVCGDICHDNYSEKRTFVFSKKYIYTIVSGKNRNKNKSNKKKKSYFCSKRLLVLKVCICMRDYNLIVP